MATKNIAVKECECKIDHALDNAKVYAFEQKEKFDTVVSEHPLAFVAGAFIGGLLVGKLISDRR